METTKELIEQLQTINQERSFINKEEVDTFIFCFLLVGYLEKAIQNCIYDALLKSQKPEIRYPELIDYLLKERTFGEKINIFKFVMKKSKSWENIKGFIDFCESINYGIRNSLFHFKLNELKYNELDVSKIETQNIMMNDLISKSDKVKKYIEENIINKKPYTKS